VQASHTGTTSTPHEIASDAALTKRVSPAPRRAKENTALVVSKSA
jgi:hypothetical protein